MASTLPLEITPQQLAFPPTTVGNPSSPITLTITNHAPVRREISVRLSGGDGMRSYHLSSNAGGWKGIAPNSSITLPIFFFPRVLGQVTASVEITCKLGPSGSTPVEVVTLCGEGQVPTRCSLVEVALPYAGDALTGPHYGMIVSQKPSAARATHQYPAGPAFTALM